MPRPTRNRPLPRPARRVAVHPDNIRAERLIDAIHALATEDRADVIGLAERRSQRRNALRALTDAINADRATPLTDAEAIAIGIPHMTPLDVAA